MEISVHNQMASKQCGMAEGQQFMGGAHTKSNKSKQGKGEQQDSFPPLCWMQATGLMEVQLSHCQSKH